MSASDRTLLEGARLLLEGADALRELASSFDEEGFAAAVELVVGCRSSVATTGAGTSGIVARKVAATLTSTGTPAMFVHPTDALHGGLGLIGDQGIVIAISNSGETSEVLDLLPYLAAREVPVIALVGRGDSTLGRAAAAILAAPVRRELDPHNMVPSASVLAAVAVADALALTVMARRGLTPDGFARNHPSGSLGRRLTLRLADVVKPGEEEMMPADAPMLDVLAGLSRSGKGTVCVGEHGRLEGIITDGDVRRALERDGSSAVTAGRAADIMTREPVSVDASMMAFDALKLMEERPRQLNLLVIRDGERFVGLVRVHDLVRLGL